jgi:hypothetical protein
MHIDELIKIGKLKISQGDIAILHKLNSEKGLQREHILQHSFEISYKIENDVCMMETVHIHRAIRIMLH